MVQYYALHPATFKLDGGAMFGIIPKPLWEKQIPADELNRIHLSLRVLCIKTDKRVILVDTGIGDYHDEKFSQRFAVTGHSDPLLNVLKTDMLLNPEDITDLIITHLHFDHVGGLTQKNGQSLFPQATVHLHRDHYSYALNPTQRDTGSFQTDYFKPAIEKLSKEKKIIWHEGKSGQLISDSDYQMSFKCSDGHTPWLMHPYDQKIIYMADLVPTSAHVPIPWVMGYDIAPGQTTIDKKDFYQFICENKLTMMFEHDMKYWGAILEESPKHGYTIKEKFAASSESVLQLSL